MAQKTAGSFMKIENYDVVVVATDLQNRTLGIGENLSPNGKGVIIDEYRCLLQSRTGPGDGS
jgi:hypothetical protein